VRPSRGISAAALAALVCAGGFRGASQAVGFLAERDPTAAAPAAALWARAPR